MDDREIDWRGINADLVDVGCLFAMRRNLS